ncbi:cytochrome P450 [Mycobacterium sherrisii]|uniref:cytochrome P450 n=1 Tax=Mycobacterium sherrisii TaxID=243061 RepID=UPI0039747EFB
MTSTHTPKCPVVRWDYSAGDCPVLSSFDRIAEIAQHGSLLEVEAAGGFPGYLLATRSATMVEVLQDPQRFSSSSVVAIEPDPPYKWIPEMLDPPEHSAWRKLLAPYFTPARIRTYDGRVRQRAAELVDSVCGQQTIDFTNDFARKFPTSIFLELFGLPAEDLDQFMTWEGLIVHATSDNDPDRSKMMGAMNDVMDYFARLITARRADPALVGDDVLSAAITWQIDGQTVGLDDLLSLCLFVFIAGLDTVASQLTWIFHHLATHDADRRRLVHNPELIPHAVEEFLRAFPIIVTGRKATVDTVLDGVAIKKGQTIMVPLPAAGRDSLEYDHASEVDFDRAVVRHTSFGAGPHRCLGSHLARLEMQIALQEWHRRMPDYRLTGAPITEHTAGTWGIDQLVLAVGD